MKKTCYFIFACVVVLTYQKSCTASRFSSLATDQSSLLALKAHIISLTITTNWTNSTSVCSWIGVTCGKRHRRVATLNISNMGLAGSIPPQLGNLSFLVSLDLRRNNFSGTLPNELSRLHRLKFISVRVNNFRGEIPSWLPFLPKLEYLSLRNNSFTGSIPQSISNLTDLYYLNFSANSLEGIIPQELGRLGKLKLVNFQDNHLSGIIPSALFNISTLRDLSFTSNKLSGNLPNDLCANLPFIEGLYFGINQLSGPIPSNLSTCSRLQLLSLGNNSFGGRIPTAIGDLKSLQTLQLWGNHLSGVVPQELGKLQNLVEINVGWNEITGALPLNIFNISSLQVLDLWRNELHGNLSRDIGNLTMLTDLVLSENNFTGVIPREIGQRLYQLELLILGPNKFTGSIPPEIFNISKLILLSFTVNDLSDFFGSLRFLENLRLAGNNLRIESSSSEVSFITSLTNCRFLNDLDIRGNLFQGTLPSSVGNLSSHLQTFFAFNCRINGRIPAEIGNLTNLITLSLDNNDLTGNIPLTLKHLLKLQGLYLGNNYIRGSIPHDLYDWHSLSELYLSGNQLSGPIPSCLGNFKSLRHLFLDSNMLTSSIPSGLWRLKDVLMLDLSANSLTGSLPPEVGNLVAAFYINLSMNQLSKSIPSMIGNLKNLLNLSLAHNRLEGSIPVSIGSMISLETLDFSYNNLSGSVPKSLQELQHLDNFNVSFNSLSGEIPNGGPFMNFTMESFKGNEALCGISRFHVPPCHVVNKYRSKRKKVEFALFILAGVVAVTTIMCLGFIFLRYRRNKATIETAGILSVLPERIPFYELARATQQFNESNLIGMGSFGFIYRGILGEGKDIAVKVFKLQLEASFRSFDIECEILRNIRHRNLTKVIGSCSNEEFKALVLEYMPKGNLEKWLYSHNYCLDFIQRLNIMIDVASALEYLHHGHSTPIIHCDLKPSNVLLDEEMVAHVSDFGLSKLLGEGESVVLTNTLATLGYIAPEYGLEGLVSTRCDVYSYGVMLMETFTRKKPSDDMFVGDLSLKIWIESSVPQSTHNVIDVNLLINLDEEHGDTIVEFTLSILELAFKCSTESPTERINMKEALVELQKIKGRFLG